MQSETVNIYVKENSHTIASQVLFFRIHRGLTQKQLAALCGMKQSAIARLEKTPDTKWTTPTLMRIAAALDVRVSADIIPNEDLPKSAQK